MHECFICGRYGHTHRHHVYGGSLRKTSEKYGAVVRLCPECHVTGQNAVHGNGTEAMKNLQRHWQAEFEKTHSREEFMRIFGRNFLCR